VEADLLASADTLFSSAEKSNPDCAAEIAEYRLEGMRPMAGGEEATARGPRYRMKKVRNAPPPVQRRLPILIGGDGEKKTLHTVAKYADAWNTGGDIDFVRHKDAVLRQWCERVGRDESEIERTLGLGLVIIRDDKADARRVDDIFRRQHPGYDETPKMGTSEQIAASLVPYVELGFRHILFDAPAPFEEETLERFVREVKPILEASTAPAVRLWGAGSSNGGRSRVPNRALRRRMS